MQKLSKISYRVYPNERLRPVLFHGQETHPLYVQLIHGRKPVYFKSYFFDLLSAEKYIISGGEGDRHPDIAEMISKEERVLNCLTQPTTFSIDTFKDDYLKNSFDLLHPMDDQFKYYMQVFFMDEGKSEFARIVLGAQSLITSDGLLRALKDSLKPALYNKLVEHAIYYAPPYLPLEAFSRTLSTDKFATFSLYEWSNPLVQQTFKEFLLRKFPEYDFKEISRAVKNYIHHLVK